MQESTQSTAFRSRFRTLIGAVIAGIAIAMVAANVWPLLLTRFGTPLATGVELSFLCLYLFWTAGGGPPRRLRANRRNCFRLRAISGKEWFWGSVAAVSFAAAIHAAIVLLFRFVPFPAAAFHRGYDLSFIPSRAMQWTACIVSAMSAGICEETGFRGYMQQPIESRFGPAIAIAISSVFFTLVHLSKDWALIGILPIVLGAGILLGALAHASGTLVFGMIGHTIMDVGLFAYWWAQIGGTFTQRPIAETGIDVSLCAECLIFALLLVAVLGSIRKLRRLRPWSLVPGGSR